MGKTITVSEIKTQMNIVWGMLKAREVFLVESIEFNKSCRRSIKPSDDNAAEDYDLLLDEAMELRAKLAEVRIAITNISNDLLRIY